MTDDPLATVRERARTNLFWRHLGIEVVDAKPGWVRLRVPIRDEIRNAAGAPVHGGAPDKGFNSRKRSTDRWLTSP